MIVAVRFHGSALPPLALAEARRIFTIGSGDADLVVPAELAIDVAPVHAMIERVEGAIIVRDHGAGHGLRRSPRSPRVASLHLEAGSVGWIGGCPLLALDHRLATLRPRLGVSMGLDADTAVDDAITTVADGAPIALIGSRSLDALPLARAIHDATTPGRTFTVYDGARVGGLDGAIVIDVDRVRRLPRSQVAAMFDARCSARVIFLASHAGAVRARLDTYAPRVRPIDLVPLARRAGDVVRLLQLAWRDELGTDRSVDALGARSLVGLASYRWPQNLDELREQSARLLAYSMSPSLRSAARALGIKHQTLSGHLRRIGVVVLDQADRDLALPPPRSGRTPPP